MKEKLKKWLGIKECQHTCTCLKYEEASKALGELLQQYSQTECSQCKKPIIAHYAGFYRNLEGKVFCSHTCIDANKLP